MKITKLCQTLVIGSTLTVGLMAQPAEPYHGQTDVPNEAAANDQPNNALSGTTPETNSTLQETRMGDMGFDLGWLGLLGLAGLFGIRGRSTHTHSTTTHHHTPPRRCMAADSTGLLLEIKQAQAG